MNVLRRRLRDPLPHASSGCQRHGDPGARRPGLCPPSACSPRAHLHTAVEAGALALRRPRSPSSARRSMGRAAAPRRALADLRGPSSAAVQLLRSPDPPAPASRSPPPPPDERRSTPRPRRTASACWKLRPSRAPSPDELRLGGQRHDGRVSRADDPVSPVRAAPPAAAPGARSLLRFARPAEPSYGRRAGSSCISDEPCRTRGRRPSWQRASRMYLRTFRGSSIGGSRASSSQAPG